MSVTVTAIVVASGPGDVYRAGRTLRAVGGLGLRVVDGCRGEDIPLKVCAGGALWVLRAGAWPRDLSRVRFPSESQTGKPLLALGATLCAPDATAGSEGAKAWKDVLVESGGDLASVTLSGGVIPAPFESVYLGPGLVEGALGALNRGDWFAYLNSLTGQAAMRCIRFTPLDVFYDERVRVAEVITSLQRGGAERVVIDLAASLPSRNVHVTVVTTGRPLRGAFPNPPATVSVAAAEGGRAGRMMAAACAARAAQADLVHAHLFDTEDLLAFRAAGLPVLLTIHNARPGWTRQCEALTPNHVDFLAACSRYVEGDLREAGVALPVRTAWNGIDLPVYAGSPGVLERAAKLRQEWCIPMTDAVVLALANPRRQKRLHLLPEVLRRLREGLARSGEGREAWLVIAGEASIESADAGDAERVLQDEMVRSGQGGRIIRAAGCDDVAALLHASDALISMSEWEGLSLAHLEALAAGRPVVATAAGGTPEIAARTAALRLLPLQAKSDEAASVLLEALASPCSLDGRAAMAGDFCRYRMAERYSSLFPRVIVQGRRRERQASGEPPVLWLITNNFSTGGAQSSARRLLCDFAQRGVNVRAAVVQEQPAFPTHGRRTLEESGIRVVALPPASPHGSIDPLAAVGVLLEVMDREDRPQRVLMWNLLQQYKVLLADLLVGVPIFDVSPGEMYFASLDKYFANPRPGLPYRSARDYGERLAGMIVKYEAERQRAQESLGVNVHVIPNGVPLPGFSNAARAPGLLVFGTTARLSPQKKLEDLLAGFRLAQAGLPPWVLKIAGGPEIGGEEYAGSLRRSAEGLPVDWIGEVTEIPEYLASLDVFVMISEPAGCPNATLEAMAAGLPVVATDFGGAAEQVVDGVTGRLTPRGEAAALAEALVCVARDRALRAQWGQAGRARIESHFSLDRMTGAYMKVLGL